LATENQLDNNEKIGLIGASVVNTENSFDVVLLADMARGGDLGLRIRRELQALSGRGYRCGLRHLGPRGVIGPDIARCLRDGLAVPLAPDEPVETRLAIGYVPQTFDRTAGAAGIKAERVVLVVDTPPSLECMGHWFAFGVGPVTWAPANRWVRARIEELGFPVPVSEEDWRAIATPCRPRPDRAPLRLRPVAGRVGSALASQWPETSAEIDTTYPAGGAFDIWMHGGPPPDLEKDSDEASDWVIMDTSDMSVERFIEALDVFAFFPGEKPTELPEASIVAAMASGKPVILPHRYRPHFGDAALYAEPGEALDAAAALLGEEGALAALREAAAEHCRLSNSEEAYLARIEALIGAPNCSDPAPAPVMPRPSGGARRILFVPSSGVGLGHTTRLLAIARRLDHVLEPVFANMGHPGVLHDAFGYHAEFIAAHADTDGGFASWDRWFSYELAEIIERYDPAVVVFDGNNPTDGLIRAAMTHGATRLAWVRRGMCPEKPSPYLGNTRFFDCVIEPGEYAAERDTGPTVRLRHEVVQVPPIRLLDDSDLLDRDTARAQMGLDPDKPAVLVQPGSGANRDIVDLTDRIIADLVRFDGLQIVIAEWSNGTISLPHWPGTRRLCGYPISRYFAAFDFSVSAAGYNTFHEVIAHSLPTIFVPNRHPSMDDQGARAEFAQDHGAGFDLGEEDLPLLPTLCRAMLNPEANAVLRDGCAAFDRTNGATSAAEIVMCLAEGAP
jgi:hypothetical protein